MEKRSLLGDLWSGDSASKVAVKDRRGKAAEGDLGTKPGLSYAQVASSSSSVECGLTEKRGNNHRMDRQVTVGSKRPRSPRDGACGRCFRTSHTTVECRHQVECLRCSGVGLVAARCPVEDRRSPRRRKVHVRSKLIVRKVASPGSASVKVRHSEVELQPQGDRKGGRSLWRR